MGIITLPLREKHREMHAQVERLRVAADAVGDASSDILWDLIDDPFRFLDDHSIPDMKAEDEVLYPVVGRLMGAAEATATMSRDHLELVRLTGELDHLRSQISVAEPSVAQAKELRRVLYGLHTLLKLHLAKEEEIYLPLLDKWLTAAHAVGMFREMEQVAERARQEPSAPAPEFKSTEV
jgi:iron-sulfur cluster repair protein YtfE (RIC family)